MAMTARLDLSVWRNDDVFEYPLRVRGMDLSNMDLRMQIRLFPDAPASPLVDLAKVTNGNAQGLRVAAVTTESGVPVTDLRIRINKTTVQSLPYNGEVGDPSTVAYALLFGGRTRLVGSILILAHAFGSDSAPMNRPGGFSPASVSGEPGAGATLVIANQDATIVSIDGADIAAKASDQAIAASSAAQLAAAAAVAAGRYFPTRAAGEAGSTTGQLFSSDDGAGNVIYYRRTTAGSVEIGRAVTPNTLATMGADLIIVPPLDPSMQPRPLIESIYEADLTPQMWSGTSDGIGDWGQYFQDMINYARIEHRPIKIPPGRYPIGRQLSASSEITMRGAGAGTQRATDIVNLMTDPNAVLLDINIPAGQSALSLDIGNFGITTAGGYSTGFARAGTAIRLITASGHIVANSKIRDIIINNHSYGIRMGGVLYKFLIDNIRVGGESVQSGIPLGPDKAGIEYGVIAFQDITYNKTVNCEVTNVRNGGYAFVGSSQGSSWDDCTADGPVDLTSIAGSVKNFAVEGWTQDAGASPVNYAMGFKRFATVQALWLRAIPTGKIPIGVYLGGVDALLGMQNDGTPPAVPLYLDNVGAIIAVRLNGTTFRLGASGDGGLNDCVAIACGSVTDYGLSGTSAAVVASPNRLGFYGRMGVAQAAAIADPTDAATTQAALKSLLAYLRLRGDIKA